jgi:hypothetical protein
MTNNNNKNEKIKMGTMGNYIEFEGITGAWVRFCFGAGILMVAAAPLIIALKF